MELNIFNANYNLSIKNMAAADLVNGEEVVIDTSVKGAPIFQCFTEMRARLTTQRFGLNSHLLFRQNEKPFMSHLSTLQGRVTRDLKESPNNPILKAAIANINLLSSSLGGPEEVNISRPSEEELKIINAAAVAAPVINDDDEVAPSPPPRPSKGRF